MYYQACCTNAGYVMFEDITEDQYTLYARADGHSSYSAVIIANPAEITRDIFLQRVAVKYTWTVTPTTIEDKYIITLDSTFETYVSVTFYFYSLKGVLFGLFRILKLFINIIACVIQE